MTAMTPAAPTHPGWVCLSCGSTTLHDGPNDTPCCCEDCGSCNTGEVAQDAALHVAQRAAAHARRVGRQADAPEWIDTEDYARCTRCGGAYAHGHHGPGACQATTPGTSDALAPAGNGNGRGGW